MKISVIIPVLNEEKRIGACLERLAAQPNLHELIVVDGGSHDQTRQRASAHSVRLLRAPRGRGPQLNAGAGVASGDVLLFLHADVVLPPGAAHIMARTLADAATVAGAFRTWTLPEPVAGTFRWWWSPLLHLADVRSRYARLPYGDQAVFVRATAFAEVGGFPDIPIMEDLALSRRLCRLGTVRIVSERVLVSGRRFQSAPLRQTLWVNLFPLLHALGVPAAVLARLYGNPR